MIWRKVIVLFDLRERSELKLVLVGLIVLYLGRSATRFRSAGSILDYLSKRGGKVCRVARDDETEASRWQINYLRI